MAAALGVDGDKLARVLIDLFMERTGPLVSAGKVVDGDEEARLAFIGAQAAIRLEPGDRLYFYVSGRSPEGNTTGLAFLRRDGFWP